MFAPISEGGATFKIIPSWGKMWGKSPETPVIKAFAFDSDSKDCGFESRRPRHMKSPEVLEIQAFPGVLLYIGSVIPCSSLIILRAVPLNVGVKLG